MRFRIMVFALVAMVGCGRSPATDDAPIDFDRSFARALRTSVPAYPGADVEIALALVGNDGSPMSLDAPVRIGCRGANPRGDGQPVRRGRYRFWVEPRLDARRATCAISLGSRVFPKAVGFDIVAPCARETEEIDRTRADAIARRYAPVFYQDVGRSPRADFLAAIDFDDNLDARDNRENLDAWPLVGTVYYSVVETSTHVFVVYAVFHPVNYGFLLDGTSEFTENNMTGLLVVADRSAPDRPPIFVETYVDGQFLQYSGDARILPRSENIDGVVPFEDRTHPRVFLEAGRHGCLISSDIVIGEFTGEPGGNFLGGDGVVYRAADEAREPESPNDRNASYRLVSTFDTLWKMRGAGERSPLFVDTFRMETGCEYPERFASSGGVRRGGRPPWAWDDTDDEDVRIGEWFLWPAWVTQSHVQMPQPFDLQYVSNPCLGVGD
ncbi:MAG: hypothetical protein IT350_04925 [Deltaproteobacteria bacterium]|nr:hypothetical protein [Deltaproteobacteria bacterium]